MKSMKLIVGFLFMVFLGGGDDEVVVMTIRRGIGENNSSRNYGNFQGAF
jgi:hypothetical protein